MSTPFIRPRSRCAAFTLIELLTVIAIVGILAAIVITSVGRVRESVRASNCLSNLRQTGMAALVFSSENQNRLPGTGTKTAGSSASWHDIINYTIFDGGTTQRVLQRMGSTPVSGLMYCPSIEPYGESGAFISATRAYVMNGYVQSGKPAEVTSLPGLSAYVPGRRLNEFPMPAATPLVFESNRNSDYGSEVAPLGSIAMGNDTRFPPTAANTGTFSFRHGNRMNIVFMDGHADSLDPAEVALLNTKARFQNN